MTSQMAAHAEALAVKSADYRDQYLRLRDENVALRASLAEAYAYSRCAYKELSDLRTKIGASPTAVIGPVETDVYKTWNADATCEIEVSDPFSTLKETELPAEYAGKRVRIVLMEQDQEDFRQYIG